MLKHKPWGIQGGDAEQPPSGGCVLKLSFDLKSNEFEEAAAFGRLCVETQNKDNYATTN